MPHTHTSNVVCQEDSQLYIDVCMKKKLTIKCVKMPKTPIIHLIPSMDKI
jgi:hypothetical protein